MSRLDPLKPDNPPPSPSPHTRTRWSCLHGFHGLGRLSQHTILASGFFFNFSNCGVPFWGVVLKSRHSRPSPPAPVGEGVAGVSDFSTPGWLDPRPDPGFYLTMSPHWEAGAWPQVPAIRTVLVQRASYVSGSQRPLRTSCSAFPGLRGLNF